MIKKLKSKLITSIKNKRINVFLLFLIISFGTLILMKLSKTYTNTISFQINKINIPEDKVVFNDEGNVLNISIKTHGFNLLKYYFNKPKIDLNFSKNITKTDSFYVWNNSSAYSDVIAQFDKNVEIVNIIPDTLRFRYDVNTIKMIPIKLNVNIDYAIGYDLIDSFKIIPDSIKLIGPEALVSQIDFIETDTLRLKDIKNNIENSVKLKLPEKQTNLFFSTNQITFQANIGKFTEGNLKIPVHIINVPKTISLKYFPKKVNVSYYTSLENYKSISVEDFKIECDFSEINEKQTRLIPKLTKIPSIVKNAKISQEEIEFIITE